MTEEHMARKMPTGRRLRVLFVEDDPLARLVVRKGMENAGHLVVEADSRARATALLDTAVFDVVVLDHRLPDGAGLDILRHMRTRRQQQKVIFLTAEPEAIGDNLVRELSISRILSKPVNIPELVMTLQDVEEDSGTAAGEGGQSSMPAPGAHESPGTGRFSMLRIPSILTPRFLNDLVAEPDIEPWLALDFSGTDQIGPEVMAGLSSLARKCRAGGGRLCLVGARGRLLEDLRKPPLSGDADLYPDASWLEPAGRRISSAGERESLLGSVVKGDAP